MSADDLGPTKLSKNVPEPPTDTATSKSDSEQPASTAQLQQPAYHQAAAVSAAAEAAPLQECEHPFETDPGDHAETPFEAYAHLDLLLARLAKRLDTTKAALRIYDPFYCEGRMLQHMAALGYEHVYNRNEDFYAVKAAGRCSEYDVLVTNPPFSGDHLERIFRFAVNSGKPWCLLVPQYVARKAFYLEWLNNQRPKGTPKPCFLAPTKQPYVFTAPDRADVRDMRLPNGAAAASSSSSSAGSAPNGTSAGASTAAADANAAAAAASSLSAMSLGSDAAVNPTAPAAAAAPHADTLPADAAANAGAVAQTHSAAAPPDAPTTPAAAAAAAAGVTPAGPKAFEVAAGSFQCVWFFSLGERHHKPVFEWLQQQQQQEADGAGQAAPCDYTVAANIKDVPQLMAVPKLTPAERRWRKKMAAAGGQPPDGDPQQQQQQQNGGRAAGGRPSSGRQQQQRQQQQGTGRLGGRGAGGGQHFGGRMIGGRFGVALQPGVRPPSAGVSGPAAAAGRQPQQQQQQPAAGRQPRS